MIRIITIEELLAKPICMMTGEEFTLLLNNTQKVTAKAPAEVALENFADLVRWQLQKVDPHIGAVA